MYPEFAEVCGREYKINTDYHVALQCFEIINDETIDDYERALAIIYLLFGFVPDENADLFLEKAKLFLRCGKPESDIDDDEEKDIDFNFDSGYIMASFMSDYKIDLSAVQEMHFWQYIDLIGGLTKNCVMSRVRELRNYDLSEIKDAQQREEMARAKESVRLPQNLTRAQQRAFDEFDRLLEESKVKTE